MAKISGRSRQGRCPSALCNGRRLLLVVVLQVIGVAQAAEPENITAGEIALLPEFCADAYSFSREGRPGNPTPRQAHWISLMGEPFWGIHHYCWALVGAHRALQAGLTQRQRDFLYKSAIDDCYFVIKRTTSDFILLPEILTRVGQYFVALRQPAEATDHFEQARKLKPDYWPAYLGLSDLYVQLGRRRAAIEILEAGLEAVPGEQNLKRALDRLLDGSAKPRPPRAAASAP